MRFRPFRRAQQPPLLAVPGGENDGARRPPPGLEQGAERARRFVEGHLAGDRVVRAVHPGVVVVTVDHPLIGVGGPADRRDYVVQRPRLPVELQREAHPRRPAAHVVSDRQRAAPRLGRDRPAQVPQQRQRVTVGDRQHGDRLDRLRLADGKALGSGHRPPAWREGVAGIRGHVHHAAALHALPGPHRPLGIDVVAEVTVVAWVREDQAADRAVLGRHLGFDPPPRLSVTRDHDLAPHADPQAVEHPVVRRHAVIHIDQLAGDLAVGGVRVEGGELLVFLARGGIFRQRRLLQRCRVALGSQQLERAAHRPRHQRLELLDLRVQPEGAEPCQDQLGHVARALGTGLVGHRGEQPHLRPQGVTRGHRAGKPLAAHLVGDLGRGEAADRGGGGGGSLERRNGGEGEDGQHDGSR